MPDLQKKNKEASFTIQIFINNHPQTCIPELLQVRDLGRYNICQLMVYADKFHIDVTFLCIVSNKMMPYLNMFSSRVLNGVFSEITYTSVVTSDRNMIKGESIVYKLMFNL